MISQSPPIDHLFKMERFGGQFWWLNLLYFPIGACLVVLRIFIGLHALLVYALLPRSAPLRTFILRTMFAVTGIVISAKDLQQRSRKSRVLVSNCVSCLDHIAVDTVIPCVPCCCSSSFRKTSTYYSFFNSCGMKCMPHRGEIESSLLQEVRKFVQTSTIPIYCQPEGVATSGCKALLKYRSWAFSIQQAVQPVTVQVYRPLGISVSTLQSSLLADLWWTLYSPFSLYNLRVLPPVEQRPKESVEQFADHVQKVMAASLCIDATEYTSVDKAELVKKLAVRSRRTSSSNRRTPTLSPTAGFAGTKSHSGDELERMAANIKAALPQVPLDVIKKDLRKTRDADVTMTNILEGTIAFAEEQAVTPHAASSTAAGAEPSASSQPAAAGSPPQPPKAWHAAETFGRCGKDRHQSLAERKQMLLEGARRRYIEKHGLTHLLPSATADGRGQSCSADRA